jgi:hypothetical protein
MANNPSANVSAIQLGSARVEYLEPDLGLAYSALAPHVCEAYAFLKCGNLDAAATSLRFAREIIHTASLTAVHLQVVNETEEIEGTSSP